MRQFLNVLCGQFGVTCFTSIDPLCGQFTIFFFLYSLVYVSSTLCVYGLVLYG